jgi:hypothetical protein
MLRVVWITLLGAACDTGLPRVNGAGDGGAVDGGSAECMEATMHSDYAWIQEKIFTRSCAKFSSCHMGSRPAASLNLTVGKTIGETVNVDSLQAPQYKLIAPGDPDASYLYFKMTGQKDKFGPNDKGMPSQSMPYNNPLLCVEKQEAVRRWIAEGALEQPIDAGVPDGAVDAGTDAGTDAGDAG